MPRLFHKNRSAHSLLSSQEADERDNQRARFQHSPSDSPIHSPAYPPPQYQEDIDDDLDPPYSQAYRGDEARYYQLGHPTRSLSQRNPGQIDTNLPQPTINLVGPAHSTPTSTIDENAPDSFYRQEIAPNPPPHKEDKKKRRFFGLGTSSKEPTNNPPPTKLGRSISVRRREQLPEPGRYPVQRDWHGSHSSPTDDYEEEVEGDSDLVDIEHRTNPPLPDKEPLRSPGFPPTIARQDYSNPNASVSSGQSRRSPLDRQSSWESPWTRASSSVHHHTFSESATQQAPSSATSVLSGHHFNHRSPSDSLQQPWQDQIPSRPSSQQSLEPPPPNQVRSHESHHVRSSSSQGSSLSHYTQSSMVHPPAPQGPSRRPSEVQQDQQSIEQGRPSTYQPYAQGSQDRPVVPSNAASPYGSQLTPQNQAFRGPQAAAMQSAGHEQGRSTPPPSRSRDDLSNMDLNQLQTKHDELQEKYRKVKKYYFDKDAQVQQLQNTLAHQRLSQSKTSLDDNEYANRFSRLDGAINNLAFNIRRDWRQVPPWLAPCVNRDACTNPTKEMTAVGRAAVARWLVDELFERYFHPALEPGLSAQLKIIEKNLRRNAAPTITEEEKELLVARISSWRLTTVDGLQDVLNSPQAIDNRNAITEMLIEKLLTSLCMMLKEPRPPGIEGGVAMIVELAVGIAANLPLESRDVFVEYIVPGQIVNESIMRIESGLPALINPGDGPGEGEAITHGPNKAEDAGSIDSREAGNNGEGNVGEEKGESPQQQPLGGGKKKGMFGSFIGGGATNKKGNVPGPPQVQASGPGVQAGTAVERKEDRVRFSTFMAAQVRGRNVLVKAPVYVKE